VLQAAFVQRVGPPTWRALLDFAARLNRDEELREWAIAAAEELREWAIAAAEELAGRPHGSGSDLINVYLSESRLEEAWRAAKRFGAGRRRCGRVALCRVQVFAGGAELGQGRAPTD
jgi:hypothetical protein